MIKESKSWHTFFWVDAVPRTAAELPNNSVIQWRCPVAPAQETRQINRFQVFKRKSSWREKRKIISQFPLVSNQKGKNLYNRCCWWWCFCMRLHIIRHLHTTRLEKQGIFAPTHLLLPYLFYESNFGTWNYHFLILTFWGHTRHFRRAQKHSLNCLCS